MNSVKTNGNGIEWTPELERELYSQDEILSNRLQARVMCALIDARRERNISQRDLEEMSGVKRSTIARFETGATSPTISTLIKMLLPLGLTLDIVRIPKQEKTLVPTPERER